MTGQRIRISNTISWYIFTFVNALQGTLDAPYQESVDAVNVSFTIWQPLYSLPSGIMIIDSLQSLSLSGNLDEISREQLDRISPQRLVYGPARTYAPAQDTAAGLAQIEVYPGPDTGERLPGRGHTRVPYFDVNDTDVLFPDWFSIPCVTEGVKAQLYENADDQARASYSEKMFLVKLAEMAGEDARKTPPSPTNLADRYTIHRTRRTMQQQNRANLRNWRSA
jgi:hypothetical protein